MLGDFGNHIGTVLAQIEEDGLNKREREIAGPQGARIVDRASHALAKLAPPIR